MDEEIKLSVVEAYLAMYAYVQTIYDATGSDAVAGHLSIMSLLSDGETADPAVWEDWMKCVNKALTHQVDANLHLK